MVGMNQPGAFEKVKNEVADKVRKLLNQAEDPAATPEEAAAFTAKAQQLMTKYAIDLAMVTEAEVRDSVVVEGWRIEAPYAAYKVSLVNAAGRANDCRAIYSDLSGGARFIQVVGFPHDIGWVRTLSGSLELQMTAALAAAVRTKPDGVHGRTYAVGFVSGFVDEVAARLAAARREAVAAAEQERQPPAAGGVEREGANATAGAGATAGGGGAGGAAGAQAPSVALVLAAKDRQVDEEYRVKFPHARNVHRYVRLQSWSGYQPGRAAGRRAQLARGQVGSRRSLSA
jgi:hypothetical protein